MHAQEIVGNVYDLLPAIRRRAEEIEQGRRLPADLANALRSSGIYSLGVPEDLGGAQAPPLDLMRAIEMVATADGSAGWCAMVGTGNNVVAGYMDPAGAGEVFVDPRAPSAGIAAPMGQAIRESGGVRVTGRWPFASGITHSPWLWAGCLVMENGQPRMTPHGPEIVHVCVPVSDVQIHDTWFVSGLCGSGSHDVSVGEVFVPDRRVFALLDPSRHRPDPLYQMPPLGLFVYQLATVGLGIARRALDDLVEIAQTKVPTLYTAVLADRAAMQVDLARAEAALGAARAYLYDVVEEIWKEVLRGRPPSARQLALGRLACTHAVETSAAVTRAAGALAGGSAIYQASPMQRHVRDAEAIAHHFTVAPHSWEEGGRVLLGRPTVAPVF